MGTVRIPLGAFGPTDNVRRLRLRFPGDSLFKTFHVDDIRLENTASF